MHDVTDRGGVQRKVGRGAKHYHTSRQKILGLVPELHLNKETTINVKWCYHVTCFVALNERKLMFFLKLCDETKSRGCFTKN